MPSIPTGPVIPEQEIVDRIKNAPCPGDCYNCDRDHECMLEEAALRPQY